MTNYIVSQLFNSIVLLTLSLVVYLKNNKNEINRTFALHCLAGSIWTFSFAQMCLAQTPEQGLFWSRALHLGAIPIPVFFLHFNLTLIGKSKEKKQLLIMVYSICFLLLLILPTKYFVSHTINTVGFNYFVGPAGLQYFLFPVFFASLIIYALFLVFRGLQQSSGLQRTQLKFIFIASLVGYTGGACAFLPLFNIPTPKYALYLVSIYNLIIAFSIIRYRLFDIEIILKKLFYHLAVFTFTAVVFTLSYLSVTHFSSARLVLPYLLIMIATSFSITYLVQHYHHKLDNIAEKAINNKRRKMYDALQKIPAQIKGLTETKELFAFLCTQITAQLNVDYTTAYLMNQGKTVLKQNNSCIKNDIKLPDEIEITDPIMNALSFDFFETEVARRERTHADNHTELMSHIDQTFKASLFIPLVIQKNIAGIIIIGYHRERQGFTDRELLILKNISIQASLVLENITLYDQVIRENRLELIGTMAASLAHEIKNPLTSIRTFVELLPTKTNDANFMERFNRLIPGEVDRLLELTNNILRFSQSKDPIIEKLNFRTLFEKCRTLLKNNLQEKQTTVNLTIQGDDFIFADANQFLQVLLNLLLNAIQASPENASIDVHLSNLENIQIQIIDHGCGIAPQNLERIFEPFYSSKIYGTGLGLANCLRIIESHRGQLSVESQLEQGSTFTITLPYKKLES